MSDVNVQIKQRNGSVWDFLYPVTKAGNVIQDSTHRFVTDTDITNWNNKQTALGFTPENSANKNKANGYAGLDSNGKVLESALPKIAISDTFVVASQTEMLALSAEVGDIAVRTDLSKSYILKTAGASTLANWQELMTPTNSVTSVNGKVGAVSITKNDVGLANGVNLTTSTTEPTAPVANDLWLAIV
jgi:hypothetical protein